MDRSPLLSSFSLVIALGGGCFLDDNGVAALDGGGGANLGGTAGAGNTPQVGGAGGDAAGGQGGEGGAGGVELPPVLDQACKGDDIATGVANGELTCGSVDESAGEAINGSCNVYYGWTDGCDDCVDPPAKWGRTSALACVPNGGDCTCQNVSLEGESVEMFGLNVDNQVDENDRFSTAFACAPGETSPGDCASGGGGPGRFLIGFDGAEARCADVDRAVLAYVRQSCGLLSGWRSDCIGCGDPPTKLGRATTLACDTGIGGDNRCTTPTLGGTVLEMLSVDVDGDADDDRFYMGLSCEVALGDTETARGMCPEGMFVSAVNAEGLLECRTIDVLASRYFKERCRVYFGWRDNCNDCNIAPDKWGWVRDGDCHLGNGSSSGCLATDYGGQAVNLLGIHTPFNVDGNDKYYVGFRCE